MRALATQEGQSQKQGIKMGMRHALKPKTPSASARFSYINRSGKYKRDKEDLVHAADHNMPDFAVKDAAIFWQAADEYERSDARLCLEIELNLPQELKTVQQQIAIVERYIEQLNKKAGRFPISYAIHNDRKDINPHVHFMFSERDLDGVDRPAELYFRRSNSKKPERGGAKKSRWWHSKRNVFWSRAAWADSCNEILKQNGFKPRFDPRTKVEQRAEAIKKGDFVRAVQLSTLTETHEGPHVGGIRKRLEAGQLERGDVDASILEKLDSNDTIKTFNAELKRFAATAAEQQLRAFLECEKPTDRVDFIANLIEPEPEPEPEQSFEVAAQESAQQLPNEGKYEDENLRKQSINTSRTSYNASTVSEHVQHLFILQARRNNKILQSSNSERQTENLIGKRDTVRSSVQPFNRAARDELLDVRSKRVTLSGALDNARKRFIEQYRSAIQRLRETGRRFQKSFAEIGHSCADASRGSEELTAGADLLRRSERHLIRAHRAAGAAGRGLEQADQQLEQSGFELERQLEPLQHQRESLDRATGQLFDRINAAIEREDREMEQARNASAPKKYRGPKL